MNLYILILIAIYAIPILRLALIIIPPIDAWFLRKINSFFGRIEWFIKPWRDSIVLAILLFLVAKGIYLKTIFPTVWFLGFVLISVFSIIRFNLFARRVAEFARQNRFIHPKEFFDCYYSGFGFIPTKLPLVAKKYISPADCSFKNGAKHKRSLWPLIIGVFNTCSMAKIIMTAFKWRGAEYSRKVANSIYIIWGGRVAYLGKFSVKAIGLEKITGLRGKFIFAFNHKSFLDFALGAFAISAVNPIDRDKFDFRYLAARDHFLDNPFLYFIMGKAMRVAGTIFVNRSSGDENKKLSALQASEELSNFDVDIAIFPQGTRAYANITPEGKRLDSGYYTSGNKERLKHHSGHLKKGAAHIAVDTAILLKKYELSIVNIIPVGLINTGLAAPRGKLKVLCGVDIFVKVGLPISITGKDVSTLEIGSEAYRTFVEDINVKIDLHLKEILELHSWLEKRFFTDIRPMLTPSDYEHVAVAMKAWRGRDYLVYTIIDCIYATHPRSWDKMLRELCYLLTSDVPPATFMHFKERVVDIMVEGE